MANNDSRVTGREKTPTVDTGRMERDFNAGLGTSARPHITNQQTQGTGGKQDGGKK